MANQIPNPPPGFDEMPVGEQIAYIGSLWDRVASKEHQVPVPPAHLAELKRRLAEHHADPDNVRDWSDVEAELRLELATRRRG